MPPNPPSNAHGFAMRSMSLRDMQIPKSEKKNSCPPPLPNPGYAPGTPQHHGNNPNPSRNIPNTSESISTPPKNLNPSRKNRTKSQPFPEKF